MNIWFKTSRSRGSTSNSRVSRFDTKLPIITEHRPRLDENEDQENQSDVGNYEYQRLNPDESESFENKEEKAVFTQSVYGPSQRSTKQDPDYQKLYNSKISSKYKDNYAQFVKKSVRFNLHSKDNTSNEKKTYQIYEESEINSIVDSHCFIGDNSNLKFKHIKRNELGHNSKQSQVFKQHNPNEEEGQQLQETDDSVFTFEKAERSNSLSQEIKDSKLSNFKRLQTSLQNNVYPTSQKPNLQSLRSTSRVLNTGRSNYSKCNPVQTQNEQTWSALRSRRDLNNTKTTSYKQTIRQHIISIIEYCSNEVGLAVYNTTNGEIHLCQIIQRLTYLRTLSTIERFYPLEIIYSASLEHTPLIKKLNARFRNVTFKGFKRLVFDETKGHRIYTQRGNKEDYNPDNKFIAYSALNALIFHIQNNLETKFNYSSLSIKWHLIEDLLIIESQTIGDLQIFLNAESKRNKNCFIQNFSCLTHGGNRMLRANLLQPLANYKAILERQQLVSVLLEDKTLYDILCGEITKFRNFELVTAKLIQSPRQKNIKSLKIFISAIYTLSHQCLLLKKFYQKVTLYLQKNLPLISKLFNLLNDPKISQIRQNIEQNFDEQILKTFQSNKPIKRQNFIFLFKLQKLQDEFIEILRINYSHTMQEILKLFKQIREKSGLDLKLLYNQFRGYYIKSSKKVNLSALSAKIEDDIIQMSEKKDAVIFSTTILVSLNNRLKESEKKLILQSEKTLRTIISEIQRNIDILFDINYEISVIDMVLSFVGFVKKYQAIKFTKPVIQQNSKAMSIQGLKTIWTNEIKSKLSNDITLDITSSKSVIVLQKQANSFEQLNFLLSVGYLTILTQIGCFVPANSFKTDLYQTILSKLHLNENIESCLSHFQTELHHFKGILDNSAHHSSNCLILLDQLVKGTQYEEEISISLALITHFTKISAKTFVLISDKFQLKLTQQFSNFPAFFNSNDYEQSQDQIIKKLKKRKTLQNSPQSNPIHFQLLKSDSNIELVMQQSNFSQKFIKSYNSLVIQDQNKAFCFQ